MTEYSKVLGLRTDEVHMRLTKGQQGENGIFFIGFFLFFIVLVCYLLSIFFYPEYLNTLLHMGYTNPTVGRIASLSLGIANQMDAWIVIVFSLLLEMIQVFLLYPLFVKSWHKVESLHSKTLQSYFIKAKERITQYQPLLQRYGLFGLMLFVLTPLAMTGPVVGSFAGFVIGFSHKKTLITIFVATTVSMALWYSLILHFEEQLVRYSDIFLKGTITIVVMIALWYIVKRVLVK